MLRILLAEDNPGDVLLVQHALAEHNIDCELKVMRDGAEALDFVMRIGQPGEPPCPDLLLLDLNLPRIDGQELLKEFRNHPQCSHTPVVVITSSDASRDRARMSELGISYYFRKPSDFDEFMSLGAIVRQVLEIPAT